MQDRGYTIPELIIVIVVVGIFSIIAINKASYAFVDSDTVNKQTEEMILIKSATAYANSIIDSLKVEDKYILGKDLVNEEYLIDDENTYTNVKLRLGYNQEKDSVFVEILD